MRTDGPRSPVVHELALSESVVAMVRERLGAARVVRVRLQVGCLMAVVPDALRFCFEVCTKDTTLDGATLEIDEIVAHATCRTCGSSFAASSPLAVCGACGSADVRVVGGDQLRIKEVEVV